VRRPGDDVEGARRAIGERASSGPSGTQLGALLGARRFRLGGGAERVAANLALWGGEVAGDAAPIITATRPPADAPSVALGPHAGTLGPRSFGFLNVIGGVAALDAPIPALPRRGRVGLVVPGREALPDVVPLWLARGLGMTFAISVGDGDPAESIAFLSSDPSTEALAVVLGAGARGAALRQVLGAKPAVVWTEDALCRAVARRAGCAVVDALDAWLAHAALLDAGIAPGARVRVVVRGGGRAYVERLVRAAGLDAPVSAVDERAADELVPELNAAAREGQAVVVVAGAVDAAPVAGLIADGGPRLLDADLRHPEALSALLSALAEPALASADDEGRAKTRRPEDRALRDRVRAEAEGALSDHDAKRLLKAWGARVSRQAPAPTPTGAVKLAKTIGLPVTLLAGGERRVAETLPEVRQAATMLLGDPALHRGTPGAVPSVLVREHFPDQPRARVIVAHEEGLGFVLRVETHPARARDARGGEPVTVDERDAYALLPLGARDAALLAAAAGARRAPVERALAELLARVAACAESERCELDLELYVGPEPAIVGAAGHLR
jgi:hypothetical protein